MDFRPSDEQALLRETARAFLAERAPRAHVRAMIDDPRGFDPALWSEIAALGWTSLLVPEAHGGAGLDLAGAVPLVLELGRALTPLPLLPTLIAGRAIHEAGSPEQGRAWLPRLGAGEVVATLAVAGAPADGAPEAAPAGEGFELRGRVRFVPDAHAADLLVVAAREAGARDWADTSEGQALFLVPRDTPGARLAPGASLDPLRRHSELTLDGVRLPAAARLGGGGSGPRAREAGGAGAPAEAALARALDGARVLVSAEMVGGAEQCLEDAVGHAKSRVQFGRPIGVHQAVQHRCADVLFAIESARSIVHYAAWADGASPEEAPLTAAMAKAAAGDAYRSASAASIQIHGGVGFTWEYDCHLHYRRARSDEVWLGDARRSRERIARLLDL